MPKPTEAPEPAALPTANELMQRTLEAMRLEAQIAKDMDAYQKRPKRRFVGARAEEYRLRALRRGLARSRSSASATSTIPRRRAQLKLYGSLLLTVSIRERRQRRERRGQPLVGPARARRRGGEDRRDVGAVRRRSRPTSSATPTSCTSRAPGRSPRATSCAANERAAGRPRGIGAAPHRAVGRWRAARSSPRSSSRSWLAWIAAHIGWYRYQPPRETAFMAQRMDEAAREEPARRRCATSGCPTRGSRRS